MRTIGRMLLTSVVALAVSGCPPDVEWIEIVPSSVELGEPTVGTTFEMEARLWEKSGVERRSILSSDGHTPKWKNLPPWLELASQTGFHAVFRVKSAPPANGTLQVEADGKVSPEASILVPMPAITGDDRLSGVYAAARPPEVSIVSGEWSTPGRPCVTVHAFVRRAMLGQRIQPCSTEASGWAAVLSTDHREAMAPVTWTSPPTSDDASQSQDPLLALPVALRIMAYAPSPEDVVKLRDTLLNAAKLEIDIANVLLAEARAGIRLDLDPARIKTGTLTYRFVVQDCGDANATQDDEPGVLTIYYVDEFATDRAVTCHWHEGRRQESIYIDRHKRVSSTLVHEIGHALGLTLPRDGHTEVMKGFDLTNVMMCCNVDRDRLARTRLMVGQVFRMNTDPGSWLNWAQVGGADVRQGPRKQCQCGAQDPEGVCPRLAEDVAAPYNAAEQVYERDCYDRLEINDPAAKTEVPVGIVAGRRWGTSPATALDKSSCRNDLPAEAEGQFGAVAVRFDNLVRPGSCPSWAVIYFRGHGLLPVPVTDTDTLWTQVGEARKVDDTPPGLAAISVTLRYHDSDLPTVTPDRTHLKETFSELNHAGIELQLAEVRVPDGLPLGCSTATDNKFDLCYDANMTGEGVADIAGHKAELGITSHKATSASHFLARLLGLDPLTTAEVAAHPRAYDQNLMQDLPSNRGNRLTLGQVYQMHAQLGTVPTCPGATTNCPPLHADISR
jgi:hypothetical protein